MSIEKTVNINVTTKGGTQAIAQTEKLNSSFKKLNETTSENSKTTKLNSQAISELAPASTGAIKSLLGMGKAMWAIVMNPIGLILTAIAAVIGVLFLAFKSFTPVVDKVEQVFAAVGAAVNVVKNAFIAVVSGTKSLGDAFTGLGGSMSDAANEAMRLTKAQQDLDDALQSQNITVSKLDSQINKLNVQAKNRNLTEAESIALLKKSEDLQKQKLATLIKNADAQVLLARDNIANAASLTKEEKKQLKEQGFAYKEFIETRTTDVDALFDALEKAQVNRNNVEDAATAQLEKTLNKQDAAAEKSAAKQEKINSDAAAIKEKNRAKEAERQKKIDDALIVANQKKLDEEIKLAADKRALFEKSIQDTLALEKMLKESTETPAEKEEREYKERKEILEANYASTEILDAQHKEKLKKIDEDYWSAEADAAIARTAKENKEADDKVKLEQSVSNAKLDIAGNTMKLIEEIAGKGSKVGKALAIAQATINGIQGVQNAYTTASASPITTLFPAYPYIQAGLAGAFSLLQIKKIASTDPSGKSGGGGGASSGGGSAPTAPSFNLVAGTGSNQIAEGIAGQRQPLQAYVVSGAVTNAQQMQRNIVEGASL
jgi:hypothetical protein